VSDVKDFALLQTKVSHGDAMQIARMIAIIEAADGMRDRIPCALYKLGDCFAVDRKVHAPCHLCDAKRTYDRLRHPERAGGAK